MKKILVIIMATSLSGCLTGCAGVQPVINGVEQAAVSNAKAADDNAVVVLKTALCGLPFSAIARNSEIIPAVMALCVSGGAAANPANLLNAVPKK